MEITRTHSWSAINGTSFHGDIVSASYAELVRRFGEPERTDAEDKIQAEWLFVIGGEPVSLYDWKEYDTPVADVTKWHVGARSKLAGRAAAAALASVL